MVWSIYDRLMKCHWEGHIIIVLDSAPKPPYLVMGGGVNPNHVKKYFIMQETCANHFLGIEISAI